MLRRFIPVIVAVFASAGLRADEPSKDALAHFEREIRPVLVEKCLKCHGPNQQKGKLRLDSKKAILAGGRTDAAIVPGKPEESLLIEALRHDGYKMPPKEKLPSKVVRNFEIWVANGAPWPEGSDTIRKGEKITAADRRWWAFQPLTKPTPPTNPKDEWSITPIDRFVFQRLDEAKLTPAPRASKLALVRRLYFDVLGVPPTPEEARAFADDTDPKAWERLVDRLLDDPRYGEHWARYWLDLVRYSESDGWNQDAFRPHIWRYRDYVVNSFNEDKPYPQFVLEQLAGDEIPGDDPQRLEAAGFLRLGIYEYNQRDARGHWNDIMNEMTDVVGDVFLGTSMACARCHDHKFDAILQKDYFALRAFFEPIEWRDDLTATTAKQREEHARKLRIWEETTKGVRAKIDALLEPYHEKKWKSTVDKFPLDIQACFNKTVEKRTSWEHQMAYLVSRQFLEEGGGPLKDISKEDKKLHEELKKELAKFDKFRPKPLPKVMTATDFAGKPATTVIPDDPDKKTIAPAFLTVLTPSAAPPLSLPTVADSTGRRTALAKWIGRPDNPLTTRVIVNRIWQHHFGQGLVPTPNDFGRKGQPPTHPQLLDWLTTTFVENGWSLEKLHRLILTSAVWQQSARHPDADRQSRIDPSENLLWRARVRRLRAEQIRDALLSVTGELDPKRGGPSVDEKTPRRAIYLKSFRNKADTFLHGFDMANGLKSVDERATTTTPTQSLLMINGNYALARAKKLAQRLESMKSATPDEVVERAIWLTWGRPPTEDERESSLAFVCSDEAHTKIDKTALVDFCHVLFNANEFLYVD